MKRLASVLDDAGVRRVRLAKIDIEGGEWALVPELAANLARFDAVLLELHPRWSRPEDEKAMYECLARDRALYLFDESRREMRAMRSLEEFLENVDRYYFASVATDRMPEASCFTW